MRFEKARKWTAYVFAVLGIVVFGTDFLSYLFNEYVHFIWGYKQHVGNTKLAWVWKDLLGVYAASGMRFTLRLAYVISFAGLFRLRRWGVYLCLIAWLGQLVPSFIYFYFIQHEPIGGHIASFAELLVYLVVIAWCWPVLKPGKVIAFCGGALLAGLLLHTIAFILLFGPMHVEAATNDPARQEKLWAAVQTGDSATVKSILADANFHPRLRGDNCDSNTICNLISYAAQQQKGNVDIVRLLHEAGASLDEQDGGSGDTPIIRAMLSEHTEIAEYLAQAGANPLQTNRFGIPAFIVAAGEGSPAVLETMIKQGAPVNFRQKLPDMLAHGQGDIIEGVTPLMVAGGNGRLDLMETLLKYGADPSLTDKKGRSAYTYALLGKDPKIAKEFTALVKRFSPEK